MEGPGEQKEPEDGTTPAPEVADAAAESVHCAGWTRLTLLPCGVLLLSLIAGAFSPLEAWVLVGVVAFAGVKLSLVSPTVETSKAVLLAARVSITLPVANESEPAQSNSRVAVPAVSTV